MRMILERFRVDLAGADVARWVALLEDVADGWPQHLDGSLHALAEGLMRTGRHLTNVDESTVLVRAQDLRLDAYRARLSPEMKRSRPLVSGLMASLPDDGLDEDLCLDVIERLIQPDKRLPRGMDSNTSRWIT